MTDDDYDALSQKQLASIKRDMRISLEDAAVRATYKVMAELAQPEQEPDDLTIAYMAGLSRGKDLAPQRTWVGLTMQDVKVIEDNAPSIQMAIFMTEATLKDKNHGNS
jgi:hypothetical protein